MATLVLDNTLYQGYATIAEQNNISVTDAMAEALRLLKQQLKKKPSLSLRQRLEKRILELRDLPANWDYAGSLPYHQKHVIILRRLFHPVANHCFRD